MAVGFSRDRWEEYLFDKIGQPTANAVVYQARGKTIAKVWSEQRERFKRIAQKKAGVDDAEILQTTINSIPNYSKILLKADIVVSKLQSNINTHKPEWMYGLYIKDKTGLTIEGGKILLADNIVDTSSVSVVLGIINSSDIKLRDVIFDSGNNTDYWADGSGVILTSGHNYNIDIENVKIERSFCLGIYFGNNSGGYCHYVRVTNTTIKNTYYWGIQFDKVENGIISNVITSGLKLTADLDTSARQNNRIDTVIVTDIRVNDGSSPLHIQAVRDAYLSDITVASSKTDAVFIYDKMDDYADLLDNVVLSDLYVESTAGHGIHIYGGKNIRILNSTIKTTGSSKVGVRFNPSSSLTTENSLEIENSHLYAEDQASLAVVNPKEYAYPAVKVYNSILESGYSNNIWCDHGTIILIRTYLNPAITGTGTDGNILQDNGTVTFSGDGSTTQFIINHNLGIKPRSVQVTPMTADASGDFYVTVDSTNIYVNYITAPPSGTDNVKLSWYAEV